MPQRREGQSPKTIEQVLLDRITRLEKQVRQLRQAGSSTLQRTDTYLHGDAVQGETVIHSKALTDEEMIDELELDFLRRRHQVKYFHDGRWRAFGDFIIPMGADVDPVQLDTLSFRASEDLDETVIQRVEAGVVTAPSSGFVEVDILLEGVSILTDRCRIDTGDNHSRFSLFPVSINKTGNEVFWGDLITIEVTESGSGAEGLSINLGLA